MLSELHLKYRPEKLDDIVGHDAIKRAVVGILKRGTSRSFLFTGPAGIGKTTFARAIAAAVGADAKSDLIERDAATFNGIDDMRRLKETLCFVPIGGSKSRVIYLDEVHGLTKQAWNALLKVIEEPPPGVYWVLSTTEPHRVPETIKSRCQEFRLLSLSEQEIAEVLERALEAEGLDLPDEVFDALIEAADGSPRRALVKLAAVLHAKGGDLKTILDTVQEASPEAHDLCRLLAGDNASWDAARRLVAKMGDISPESVRCIVCDYFTKAALNSGHPKRASRYCAVLQAFSQPYTQTTGRYPLILSLGELLL